MGFTSEYHNKHQTGGLQHLLATQIRTEVGDEVFRDYFKFAFVRNPWDKAVSQYAYAQSRSDLRAFIGMQINDGFKRYLELIAERHHIQWEPQHKFIFDEDGNSLVDYLGRYEDYERDTGAVLRRIGAAGPVPHINASSRGPMHEYYDQESIEAVAAMYAEDVRAFGYSPPDI